MYQAIIGQFVRELLAIRHKSIPTSHNKISSCEHLLYSQAHCFDIIRRLDGLSVVKLSSESHQLVQK
ncbi:hypothetical protein DS2_07908 [Catenovulum agarivorans DS-2]|uniref:Uncharacterized protein n=1 Tax=Catenovulum agarivorans DS-2 TaxID=1328313 RepID=W7QEN5_9ALTE|nr:hypothetical protein DS2_07908 [Catenovulum agarivorans DS-2]